MAKLKRKKLFKRLAASLVLLLALLTVFTFFYQKAHAPTKNVSIVGRTSQNPPNETAPEFNKQQHAIDQAGSMWVIVNKGRILPSNYIPESLVVPDVPLRTNSSASDMQLRSDAAAALVDMVGSASDSNIKLMLASGFRSYSTQKALYNSYAQTQGSTEADKTSAHAGHSEHQTGLAADLEPANRQCEIRVCFGTTPEGIWLAANAHRFGFVIRYQKDKVAETGYDYEPWHVRYVGKELANQIFLSSESLEKFFGLPFYSYYPAVPFQLK